MRNFSWNYFALTGDVDAYLLYKEINGERFQAAAEMDEEESDREDSDNE
jgi:hypothetical protein